MTRRHEALADWTKSSYSAVNGDCVEVRGGADRVRVRDSKAAPGPVIGFDTEAWSTFLHNLYRGAPRR